MRNLIAVPVIILGVMLQSAVISSIKLLSGHADLPLVMLAAWALQEEVDTAWQWAMVAGVLVGFFFRYTLAHSSYELFDRGRPGASVSAPSLAGSPAGHV